MMKELAIHQPQTFYREEFKICQDPIPPLIQEIPSKTEICSEITRQCHADLYRYGQALRAYEAETRWMRSSNLFAPKIPAVHEAPPRNIGDWAKAGLGIFALVSLGPLLLLSLADCGARTGLPDVEPTRDDGGIRGDAPAGCTDDDGDGICDREDNCVDVPNPDQLDRDHDGLGEVCDDSDADGISDAEDNCPFDLNPDQLDTDGDSIGDVCETR